MFSSILFIYSLLITTPNRVQFLDIGAMALGFPTNDLFSSNEVTSVVPLECLWSIGSETTRHKCHGSGSPTGCPGGWTAPNSWRWVFLLCKNFLTLTIFSSARERLILVQSQNFFLLRFCFYLVLGRVILFCAS